MPVTPTMLPNGKAPNPLYNGQRIRNVIDLFPKGFSDHELAVAYRDLTWELEDERLILEAVPFDDVDEYYNPGTDDVLDGFVLEAITVDRFSRTEKRMSAVVRVLNKKLDGGEIQALAPIVGRPKKSGGYAYVTVQLPFSDGQSVSVVFHSPEGDKQRIGPEDQIIAFRWLLNKRDITHVVAPEDGAEVSLDTIAIRLMQLVQKNSARFARQQKEAFGEVQALQASRDALAAANEQKQTVADRILSLGQEYDTLAAKVANAKRAIEKQQKINADLEAKIADAKAKQVAKPDVTVTNQEANAGQGWPTTGVFKELKKEAESLVATLKGIETGVMAGYDAALFRQSFVGKVKRRLDAGYVEDTAAAMEYLKKIQGILDSPALAARNGIWKATGVDPAGAIPFADAPKPTEPQPEPEPTPVVDTTLPPGWTEASPGGLATNTDPVSGGIVDVVMQSDPEEWFVIPEDSSLGKLEGFASRAEAFKALADAVAAKSAEPAPSETAVPILPSKDQGSNPGKRVSKLLYAHGWEEKVLKPGFHAVLKNDPYLDLVIETHAADNDMVDIFLTHYVEMNGDKVLDSEIVFRTSPKSGYLKQMQTAGRGPAGEFRDNSSVFGNVITKNFIGQGFDKATVASGEEKPVEPEQKTEPTDSSPGSAAASMPTRFTTFDIPFADLGDGWLVMNAARPLVGEKTDEGEFLKGRFYAAIDLSSEFAAQNIETNRNLDAVVALKVTRTQFQALAVMEIAEKYRGKLKTMNYIDQLQALEPYYDQIQDRPYSEAKALLAEIGDGVALAPKDDADPHRGNDGDNETRPDPDNTAAGDEGTPVIEPVTQSDDELPSDLEELQALRNTTMSNYLAAKEREQEANDNEDYSGSGESSALETKIRMIDAKMRSVRTASQRTPEPTTQPDPAGRDGAIIDGVKIPGVAALAILKAIVAGGYDNDPQALDEALDGAAAELEAAGLMEQHDQLLNEAADKAAAVALEAAKRVA